MMWLIGNCGMLGTEVDALLGERGIDFVATDTECDITDVGVLRDFADKHRPQMVLNCAAYTDVDGAQSSRQLAYAVNAEAVRELGRAASRANKWVLHISTDFVFDGALDRPYVETDQPNPINEYGKSKLAGEQLLLKAAVAIV